MNRSLSPPPAGALFFPAEGVKAASTAPLPPADEGREAANLKACPRKVFHSSSPKFDFFPDSAQVQ